ncbi:MAG: cysteine synthase [Bacteroidota bacterium]|nr:cysteine synthase [Candidatus Kapabacteria bacterium]MCS7302307.1 cysteine synthase [Candidatus Kapabacteria bacterium]MDW8074402.1 cysteine synthase [Bacteroidota bacterium]MDW8271122.1 cysteine synthase [Bacteroidota bacterium]
MEYLDNVLQLIGNTPLIKLNKVTAGISAPVFVKLETRNPGGSIKDRIGIAMIEAAEKDGRLKPGGLIIEATSGNTGIGIALAAAVKGYRCLFVTTDKASQERVRYLKALGADVIITTSQAKPTSPDYYVNIAIELSKTIPNAVLFNQYDNPANAEAHYRTTGPEIWRQTDGRITHFIAGMGTGGTITGTARYLKEQNPAIQVIGADPIGSIIKTYKETGELAEGAPYLVEGVGQDRIPANLDLSLIDDIELVSDQESFAMARRLAREEGIFCGGSSGMNVVVALRIAQRLNSDACVVTIICDTGERYLTKHHSEDWLRSQQILLDAHLTAGLILERKRNRALLPALVSVQPSFTVAQVLELLERYDLDRAPVLENHTLIGTAVKETLLHHVVVNTSILDSPVADFMQPPLQTIDAHQPLEEVREKLRTHPALIVTLYGYPTGILTREDILEYINRA